MASPHRVHNTLIAAAVLVPTLLFGAAAWLNRHEVLREGWTKARHMSIIMDEHAHKVFDTIDLALDRIEDRRKLIPQEALPSHAFNAFLAELRGSLEHASSIWVSNADGAIVAGSQPWDPNARISAREFFSTHADGKKGLHVSGALEGEPAEASSFAVSRRLERADGAFSGVIHVALSPGYFARVYKETVGDSVHAAVLIHEDGRILARHPDPLTATLGPHTPFRRAIAERPERGEFLARSRVDDAERMYVYRRVGAHPVYVLFGAEVNAALAAWRRNLLFYGGVSAAAAFALLLVSISAFQHARAERKALSKLRVETEQRLKAEQKLRHAQKMESIGQFTGGVAHDFNNLLAVVLGNLRLLEKRLTLDASGRRLLEGALQGAERGAQLTQRLLAFARRQDLNPQAVNVMRLLEDMRALLQQSLGQEIILRIEAPADLPPVQADPNQLELAILNLALNAKDAIAGSGSVTITASLEKHDRGRVCIAITDTGCGMDEETLARALDPFFTTKGVGKGTGLGLSMAHGFAEQSGGELRLESRPGEGTTATIVLPASAQDEAGRQEAAVAPAPGGRAYSIVLVDDDALVSMGTAAMLEDLGHTVVECGSGAEAIRRLRECAAVDIVITDQSMPEMTGLELARHLRIERPGLPILIASGHAELPPEEAAGLPLLNKPFSEEQISRAIEDAIGRARATAA